MPIRRTVILRELVKLNSRTMPTIVVGDEVMIGFDPERLETMLKNTL